MKEDAMASCLGWLTYAFFIVVFGSIANGWALSTLWTWFVMPVFAVKALTIPYAIGLSLVISFLVPKKGDSNQAKKDSATVVIESLAQAFGGPILSVFLGWMVFQFV